MTAPDPAPAPEWLAQRLAAQLLSGPSAQGPVQVAGQLLAVQAQDQRGARLAVRARSRARSAAAVDDALTRDRSVVVTWLNRGTLHLVRTEDYWWLHPLTTPQLFTGNARRLAQEGVPPDDAERGVAVIERSLTAEGPLTRAQLGERIAATGVRTQGQAIVHLLVLASLRGIVVRGPMAGREHAYALVPDWLGKPPGPRGAPAAFDRDRALAELAARYLAGHGPATEGDLAKWAGLPLGDARRGLAAIAGRLADRADGLARSARPSARPGEPWLPAAAAAPAGGLRPGAAWLGLAGTHRRPARETGRGGRPVPPVRDGGRPCRRHLGHAGRQGRAHPVRAVARGRRGRPGCRRRGRRAFPTGPGRRRGRLTGPGRRPSG